MDDVEELHGVIGFDIRVPVKDDVLCDNVRRSLSLGLPSLAHSDPRPERLRIVANGPSAKKAKLTGHTLALNGAIRLFTDRGLSPAYWAACDPQALVADFIPDDPPQDTLYLVCSKCHPSVFEKLRDRNVILWHLDDFGTWDLVEPYDACRCAVSITIVSFEIGERLGYRTFETWGWDGCYIGGQDHANAQRHVGMDITNQVGERIFKTTRNWALEAQDAVTKFRLVPRNVIIHGNGMIRPIFDYLGVAH